MSPRYFDTTLVAERSSSDVKSDVSIPPVTSFRLTDTAGADRPGSVIAKFTILLKRKPMLGHDELVGYHKTNHSPPVMSLTVVEDTVRCCVQRHASPVELSRLPSIKYDGLTQLWFDDADALARCFGDAEYMAKLRPEEEKFLDLHGCDFIVSAATAVAD
jgi:DNA polymerase III epsilon subunit-like protein